MTTAKIVQSTRTQLSGAAAALNSLANGSFVSLGTVNHNAATGKTPLDCIVEITVTPGTVAGNKQLLLYALSSLDNTNFSSGPVSGTSVTDVTNLIYLGALPLSTNSALRRKMFSIAAAMPGWLLPYSTTLIAFNDSGASLAASGNDVYTQDNSGDIT